MLLEEAVRHVDVCSACRSSTSAQVSSIQRRIQAQGTDAVLESEKDRRIRRLLPTQVLLRGGDGRGTNKGPRPQRFVLTNLEKELRQSHRAIQTANSGNQHTTTRPVLVRLSLLQENLHVARQKRNLVPLDDHQVRVTQETGVTQADSSKFHHGVQVAGLVVEPQLEETPNVRTKQEFLDVLTSDFGPLCDLPGHRYQRMASA